LGVRVSQTAPSFNCDVDWSWLPAQTHNLNDVGSNPTIASK
jgi:hypothetical protein